MPIYEYRCPECRDTQVSTQRGSRLNRPCRNLGCGHPGPLHRVFGFALKPMMHEHFNHTVGKPISDMRQFKTELDIMSDHAEEQTGIPHRYAPVDMADRDALGVTGEGIYESNVERSKRGDQLLPDIE